MKMKTSGWFKVLLLSCATLFAACDDSSEPKGKGDVEFEITDAPTDNASVKGVFVTIADVKVDGASVSGFTKQTIDLKAYQEGNTKLLATGEQLSAKTYNNLTLVLDLDTDANGNSPGCYVLTTDDVKYKLKSSTTGMAEININKEWRVVANTTSKVIMDFDLRKSVIASEDPAVRYSFASDNNLRSAIRLVAREKAGTIEGSYEAEGSDADKIIVYAYKKGTFNATTEPQAQGGSNVQFANAVTSAEVKSSLTGRTFKLALLEEGEYELHFAAHKEDASGHMTFDTMLSSETSVNGSATDIVRVQAGVTLSVTGSLSVL